MADAEHDEATGEMSEGLQVELFHPDSEREPGDTNKQLLGGRFDVHPIVFPVALALIVLFVAATILLGDQAAVIYTDIFNAINTYFGWFYILAMNVFIVTVLYFAIGKYGKIRIGGVEAETEFSTFSWMAMLFSAGMGIGLMFFSVAEPMTFFDGVPPSSLVTHRRTRPPRPARRSHRRSSTGASTRGRSTHSSGSDSPSSRSTADCRSRSGRSSGRCSASASTAGRGTSSTS